MNERLQKKLRDLPTAPGVYFHKDKQGHIIYIGKAAVLRNRVRQYFQKSRQRDPKTDILIAEIADTDWITVDSELDALFLEAEMVRRYMPRYNILLRDDKSSLYVRITYDSDHPTVSFTRRPLDDHARYFGPYFNGWEVKRALRSLRRVFPYSTHMGIIPKRVCLQYHLGLCPGLEEDKTSLSDYRANLRQLIAYIQGNRQKVLAKIEKDMQRAAERQQFEQAAQLRDQYYSLKALSKQIIFSDKEFLDISKDRGLQGLTELLGLDHVPHRIEGYDISHMQGSDTVASMVVFTNGIPDKAAYRKFKMRIPGNNDFAHMNEVIRRRLRHQKQWGLPDLFLIDGGKGQLTAAIAARDAAGVQRPMIGLAKREEEIVVHMSQSDVLVADSALQMQNALSHDNSDFRLILLPKSSDIVKLLQRVRDESHRFAVSYHTVLKTKRQTASQLDTIPGIGPATRRKLLKSFGSTRGIKQATGAELAAVIGIKKAKAISHEFHQLGGHSGQ
ncbi:MAG TPA: excinuclease ABC subunit UvrC [Candidatus Saccharimonadales bacterium]|nr:excinuclease ABC subunit UvrC [Candidatus Saccharimonadales bacterium]